MAATDSAKAIEQYTLVFSWELVLYEPSIVGSGPEDDCTVNLNNVVDEPFAHTKKGLLKIRQDLYRTICPLLQKSVLKGKLVKAEYFKE